MYTHVSRALRTLRLRKGWTQRALGARVGTSGDTISRIERDGLAGVTVGTLERVFGAFGASVHIQVRWRGEQLDRLIDAAHAAIQQVVAEMLTAFGWYVRVEVSFNHYGDRGRVDLLAYHSVLRILLVLEIKSALGNLQDTLGRLDVKVRLARQLAHGIGWHDIHAVVPVLIIGESRRARRTITDHTTLFARFNLRGRTAVAWLRRPSEPMPTGLLWFTNRPNSDHPRSPRRPRAFTRPDSDNARITTVQGARAARELRHI